MMSPHLYTIEETNEEAYSYRLECNGWKHREMDGS